jgi:hypothetical protein
MDDLDDLVKEIGMENSMEVLNASKEEQVRLLEDVKALAGTQS